MEQFVTFFSGFLLGVTTCLIIKNNFNKKKQDDCDRYRSNNKPRHHF
jgi:hypothetical protein